MTRRVLAPLGLVGLLLAAVLLAPAFVTAQAPGAAAPSKSSSQAWKVPRTPDGQPDLQGFWTNTTYVPLERPKNVTKLFYTPEEVAENIKRAAARFCPSSVSGGIFPSGGSTMSDVRRFNATALWPRSRPNCVKS